MIYFISLVGTNLSNGLPRSALSFFDVFSEMELEEIDGIQFFSVQDLLKWYQEQTGRSGKGLTAYQLVLFFMKKHPDGLYFVDEVPFLENQGKSFL